MILPSQKLSVAEIKIGAGRKYKIDKDMQYNGFSK
jgi:hypothetical protein